MSDSKVKDLKEKYAKYAREANKNAREAKRLTVHPRWRQGPCQVRQRRPFNPFIYKGVDIGQGRSSLTASERKQLAPTRFDKMEVRILKMLSGWSIADIECLLVYRVVPEAKRRAKVPK